MPDFPFKTQPFGDYQLNEFTTYRDSPSRAILWEMGLGKTWAIINQAAYLYETGKIDTLLILAPEGLHKMWIDTQIPKHFPDHLFPKTLLLAYTTAKAANQDHQALCDAALNHKGLLIIAMTYDAAMTDPKRRKTSSGRRQTIWQGGKRFYWDLLSKRRCMLVADESRRIKNPKAERTKALLKTSPAAPYRRILNGTPVTNSPFDLYSQLKFLNESFWHKHGIGSYTEFRQMFGEYVTEKIYIGGVLRDIPKLTGYKNLPLLKDILASVSTRYTKDEVLDLPEQLWEKVRFDLTPTQQRLYDELKQEFMTYLDDGSLITAPLAITRLLRFQQMASGFIPVDDVPDDFRFKDLPGGNPRLDILAEICEDIPHSALIWCRFTRSIDNVLEMLKKKGLTAVRYDGTMDEEQCAEAVESFQDKGDAQFFVSIASKGGEGLTLTRAMSVVYYENTFSSAERWQSEGRPHRIGQKDKVLYTDLIANGTVDERISDALREHSEVARVVTGDGDKVAQGEDLLGDEA